MIRTAGAAFLLVLLVPTVVVANASIWAIRTVVDDDAFTTTVSRALDTPSLRSVMAERATTAVVDRVAASGRRLQLVAGVVLGVPGAPTRAELAAALEPRIRAALDDPPVTAARDKIVRAVHHALVSVDDRERGPLSVEDGQMTVDLRPMIEEVADVVDPRLSRAGLATVSAADATVVLGDADTFEAAATSLTLLQAMRIVIPVAVLVAILAIVALAHRRARALGIVGVAVMIAGLISLGIAWVGGGVIAGAAPDPTVGRVAEDVYGAFTSLLVGQSALLLAGGALLAVVAWLLAQRRRRGPDRR